ncbi:hypothetical protein D3C87_1251140 [compost metagenome]
MSNNNNFEAVFDVCSEYHKAKNKIKIYISYPLIDLATPTLEELSIGVEKLDSQIQNNQTTFIHCALGLSRSAILVFGWLLYANKIKTVTEGFTFFQQNNFQIHLSDKHIKLLNIYAKKLQNDRT